MADIPIAFLAQGEMDKTLTLLGKQKLKTCKAKLHLEKHRFLVGYVPTDEWATRKEEKL